MKLLASPFARAAALVSLCAVLAACSPATATTVSATSAPAATAVPAATRATTVTAVSAATNQPAATDQPAATEPAAAAAESASAAKLNLNTATADDFLTVPGVGNRMVREFMEYRPYTSIGQFRREIGKYVDASQVAAYEQYMFVPIDVNTADAATLQQLPGVTAAIANDLIAARPYASAAAFLEKLAGAVSAAELAAAPAYLTTP